MSLSILVFTALISTCNCELNLYVPYDYCDPNLKLCEVPSSHTMCRYPVPGVSEDCALYLDEPLSVEDKQYLLSLHNRLRNRVATGTEKIGNEFLPSASNMLKLHWDVELEAIAERWAQRCLNVTVAKIHDDCRNTIRFNVTQNIGTVGTKGLVVEKQILRIFYRWYSENKLFKINDVDIYLPTEEGNKAEEYTNLIWADSYTVGCSRVIFRNNISDNQGVENVVPWTFERLVCNYGPGGSIPGRSVYKRGAPCSDCPVGTSCSTEFPGLCTLNGSEVENKTSSTELITSSTAMKEKLLGSTNSTFSITSRKTPNLMRAGIYFNGICHCPDISRFGPTLNKELPLKIIGKFKNQRRLTTRKVTTVTNSVTDGKYRLNQGDRCYCKKSVSEAFKVIPSRFIFLVYFFYSSKLMYNM